MHPAEMSAAEKNLTLLVDTREQDTKKFHERITQVGWPIERVALNVGDYSVKIPMPDGSSADLSDRVAIERKFSLDELCMCYTKDRARFEREFERGKNMKIYLLVENATWEHIYNGKYRSHMDAKALTASVLAWLSRYNCVPIFCKAELGGLLIRDILQREAHEFLMEKVRKELDA